MASDFLSIGASFALAYIIRARIDDRPLAIPTDSISYIQLVLIASLIGVIIFFLNGLYNIKIPTEKPYELRKIFMSLSSGIMIILVLDFINSEHIFPSKSIPIYTWGISIVIVFLSRFILKKIQVYLFKYNIGIQRTLIVGSNHIAKEVASEFNKKPFLGYKILGYLESNDKNEMPKEIKNLGRTNDLKNILKKINIDEIIYTDNNQYSYSDIMEALRLSDKNRVEFKISPNLYGIYSIKSRISIIGGIPLIEIVRTPLEGWGRIVKRIFDITGSLLGLILFSPLFLIISIAIKMASQGPILYKHERMGRGGKTFKIYKFRSMRPDADKILKDILEKSPEKKKEFENDFKLKNDPRITKIGKFLRKTSLDEIPQFVNVLKGEMSLVGPRPIVLNESDKYGESKYQRSIVKPGITGLWQINGRSDLDYKERAYLDIYYVENWSLFLDIKIILKTLTVFFKKDGAY
jgi:exopolysaccharide biosynthesis polyprenyl glycosylphosphotransferase